MTLDAIFGSAIKPRVWAGSYNNYQGDEWMFLEIDDDVEDFEELYKFTPEGWLLHDEELTCMFTSGSTYFPWISGVIRTQGGVEGDTEVTFPKGIIFKNLDIIPI